MMEVMRVLSTTLGAALLLLAALLPAAPGPAAAAPGEAEARGAVVADRAPKGAKAASKAERKLGKLIDRTRARHGCRTLKDPATLRKAARTHTALMIRRGELSHQLSGEPALDKRVAQAGYQRARKVGEVIAMGARTPKQVLRLWLASPPHRAVLLDCSFKAMGAGVQRDARGQRWWTVVVAAR